MRLRKGREFMKKIITAVLSLALVGCIAVIFCACGADDKDMTDKTSSPAVSDNLGKNDGTADVNDGKITDVSGDNNNGVIGDIVTDVSEGISDIVTDVSEDASAMVD